MNLTQLTWILYFTRRSRGSNPDTPRNSSHKITYKKTLAKPKSFLDIRKYQSYIIRRQTYVDFSFSRFPTSFRNGTPKRRRSQTSFSPRLHCNGVALRRYLIRSHLPPPSPTSFFFHQFHDPSLPLCCRFNHYLPLLHSSHSPRMYAPSLFSFLYISNHESLVLL